MAEIQTPQEVKNADTQDKLIPISMIARKEGTIFFSVPENINVVAVPASWLSKKVSEYHARYHNKFVVMLRQIYPSKRNVVIELVPHGAIAYDVSEGRTVGINKVNVYGDITSDFVALERVPNEFKMKVVDDTIKLMPKFKVTSKAPEAYFYKVSYSFRETCDKIYLMELKGSLSFAILCNEDKEDDATVSIYYVARTNDEVIVYLESSSKYVRKVLKWDNEENTVKEFEYEPLSEQDII